MSVSEGDGDSTGDGEAGGSAIFAYEATRREKTNVLVFWMKMCLAK